jgi:Transposase DDE domain
MLGMATRGLRRKLGDAVRLIDSSLHLAGAGTQWAKHRKCPSDAEGRFSADVCGAKAHVVYDRDLGCPIYHMITEAAVKAAAKTMPVEAGATSVFDLGCYDNAWWAKLDEVDCRIVTRFKKKFAAQYGQIPARRARNRRLSDRIGLLPGRQAKTRNNPRQRAVREIVVTMQTGKTSRILSNDHAPATEIADLSNRCGQIELFFRVIVLPSNEANPENHPFHRPF